MAKGTANKDKDKAPLVLVVDDYEDAREMYSEYLEFSGFRVAEARNGIEALEKAFELVPDLILMDLSLPGMDGWEATRRLKADERTKRIPVVALTGHALAGHSEGARQAGCDAFVTKPCLPDALVVEIRRMLDQTQKKSKTGSSTAHA
jgi:two-component system, cell cycle response regulator DivK